MSMTDLFLAVLRMSLVGGMAAAAVIMIRLCLRRAPKIFSYLLWGIVFFRLLCPVSFQSSFSLLGILEQGREQPKITAPLSVSGETENHPVSPAADPAIPFEEPQQAQPIESPAQPSTTQNPASVWDGLAWIWILGAVGMGVWSAISYIRLKSRIGTATKVSGNVMESDRISTPFVCGFLRPKVYLPVGLCAEEVSCVLAHEQTHIRRGDYLVKPLAFTALCLHWFNPMVWAAFLLMGQDMEMSCDERALSRIADKGLYSKTLVNLSLNRQALICPLAFGGGNMKKRIENVIHYRKPSVWIVASAVVLLAAVGIFLLANPKTAAKDSIADYIGSHIKQIEQVQVRLGEESGAVDKDEITALLEKADWERKENQAENPEERLVFDIKLKGGTMKISLFPADASTVLLSLEEKGQTFQLPEADYSALCALAEKAVDLSDFGYGEYGTAQKYPTAESAAQAYITALLESDAAVISELTPSMGKSEAQKEFDKKIWKTIDISHVVIESEDIRETRACYALTLTVQDAGESAFEPGKSPRWLYLVKGENGWYAEGLMTSGSPDEDWWNRTIAPENHSDEIRSLLDAIEDRGKEVPTDQFRSQIEAHPDEYKKVISYGEEALLYMAEEFERGGQDGLRGRILETASREILGGEDIKTATKSGQEWYDSYKAHIARLYELNGEAFLKEHTQFPQFLSYLIQRADSVRTDVTK